MFATYAGLSGPRLAVPPEGVAFGEIPAGEAAEKAIELRNVSSFPVLISQVKGCCGADAALSAMRIEPMSGLTLKVSLKPTIPGEFSKHVRILCDDPECPVVVIPVTGAAIEMPSTNISSQWTFLTVLLAGLADGFNPCAFSIIIVLAGILAVGGRKRRARLLGDLLALGDERLIGEVLFGCANNEVKTHLGSSYHEGVAHIVARISKVYHLYAGKLSEMLLDGEEVCKDLRGMELVGETVPNGYACIFCKLFNNFLSVSAVFNSVVYSSKNAGGIRNAFLLADL